MAFKLPELSYAYDALEPHIDAKTMEIHHTKHHAGYTNKLNAAIEGTNVEGKSIEGILRGIDIDNSNFAVRNNGGGYYNHCLYWEVISPHNRGRLSGPLLDAVKRDFGSKEALLEKFSKLAATRFGSGWAWLCTHPNGKLDICSTANQDNPLMRGIGCGGTPILGIDVWEHAYYLNYQNRRPDYIKAFCSIINWNVVEAKYEALI